MKFECTEQKPDYNDLIQDLKVLFYCGWGSKRRLTVNILGIVGLYRLNLSCPAVLLGQCRQTQTLVTYIAMAVFQ